MSDAVKAGRFSALMQSLNYRCEVSTTSHGKCMITIWELEKEGDDYVNRVVGDTYESCIYCIMSALGNAETKYGVNKAEHVGRNADVKTKMEKYIDGDGDECWRHVPINS